MATATARTRRALNEGTLEFTNRTLEAVRAEQAALRRNADLLLAALLAAVLAVGFVAWKRLIGSLGRSREALVDAHSRIERMATSDALTGLPNRAALHEGMRSAMARARREGQHLSLLMIDLDRFKPINDQHGHQVGDRVLREAAQRMARLLRDCELHARYGGDEFVAVINEHRDSGAARHVADRLVAGIGEAILVDGLTLYVGASVGIARFPDDADDPDELLRRADLALYRAKSGGRNRSCFYDAALDEAMSEREAYEQRLREAIADGRIVPHYQPVVDLADRRVRSVELLSRWQDPQRGLVPPSEFIPAAERCGLIGALTMAVIRQACADLRTMPAHWRVAVNVSPEHLQDTALVDKLLQVMREHGADPRRFEIELTETALVADVHAARRTIEALKREGITVALGRLRHRLLQPVLPEPAQLRQDQDRPQLRGHAARA
jgi:diguanylate cyclase (GGDEF)-like protein